VQLHGIALSNFNNSGSIFSPLSTLFLISSKTNLLIPPKKPTNLVLSLAILAGHENEKEVARVG
jgi:hypothetical protein